MQVVDRDPLVDDLEAELVGRAVADAPLEPAAGGVRDDADLDGVGRDDDDDDDEARRRVRRIVVWVGCDLSHRFARAGVV